MRLLFLLSGLERECCMEELLVYAILLYEGLVTEAEYQQRLNALFLAHPEDHMLLDLECETDYYI